jgi:outer membrane lipoprotein LolB
VSPLIRISAILLWFTLAACASLEPAAPLGSTDFQANQRTLLAHQDWSLKGRLNVRQNQKSDSVNLSWQQQDQRFDIRLWGMIGLGSTRVYGSNRSVTVEKAGERPLQLPNLEALTKDYLSFEFPAAYLLYWVRALPVPGIAASTEFDANSRLAGLSQRDSKGRVWQLTFERYSQVQDVVLPGRIKLATGDLQLTFLVDEWLPNAATP